MYIHGTGIKHAEPWRVSGNPHNIRFDWFNLCTAAQESHTGSQAVLTIDGLNDKLCTAALESHTGSLAVHV